MEHDIEDELSEYDLLSYEDFRTGFTFGEIRDMLHIEQRNLYQEGIYMFITRRTVLGRWYQIKGQMYRDYIKEIKETPINERGNSIRWWKEHPSG